MGGDQGCRDHGSRGCFRGGGQYEAADCALVSLCSGKLGEKGKEKRKKSQEKICTCTCQRQQKCVRRRCIISTFLLFY